MEWCYDWYVEDVTKNMGITGSSSYDKQDPECVKRGVLIVLIQMLV